MSAQAVVRSEPDDPTRIEFTLEARNSAGDPSLAEVSLRLQDLSELMAVVVAVELGDKWWNTTGSDPGDNYWAKIRTYTSANVRVVGVSMNSPLTVTCMILLAAQTTVSVMHRVTWMYQDYQLARNAKAQADMASNRAELHKAAVAVVKAEFDKVAQYIESDDPNMDRLRKASVLEQAARALINMTDIKPPSDGSAPPRAS